MVSSMAPIKAKAALLRRRQFQAARAAAAELADGRYADAPPLRPDDWSGLAISCRACRACGPMPPMASGRRPTTAARAVARAN